MATYDNHNHNIVTSVLHITLIYSAIVRLRQVFLDFLAGVPFSEVSYSSMLSCSEPTICINGSWLYHRRAYFRVSQILAIFAIRPQFAKIYTREIFVSRVYPSRFGSWKFSLLFHCTMALLRHSKRVNGHLTGPTVPLSADVPPSAIQQAKLDVFCRSRNGTSARARGDRTVGLQLSS